MDVGVGGGDWVAVESVDCGFGLEAVGFEEGGAEAGGGAGYEDCWHWWGWGCLYPFGGRRRRWFILGVLRGGNGESKALGWVEIDRYSS